MLLCTLGLCPSLSPDSLRLLGLPGAWFLVPRLCKDSIVLKFECLLDRYITGTCIATHANNPCVSLCFSLCVTCVSSACPTCVSFKFQLVFTILTSINRASKKGTSYVSGHIKFDYIFYIHCIIPSYDCVDVHMYSFMVIPLRKIKVPNCQFCSQVFYICWLATISTV